MSLLIALKFICYMSLYFSFFSVFDLWMNSYLLFILTLILSGISLGLTNKFKEKTILRILFALIPVISLILCAKPLDFLVVGVPVTFIVLMGILKRGNIEYWNHISVFKILSILLFLFLLFSLMTNLNYLNIIFYGLIFLITGVFVNRELRLGANTSTKEKLYNFVFIATVPIILSIVFLIIFTPNISFGKVFEYVLTPFASLFYLVVKLFSLISNIVVQQEPPKTEEIEHVIEEYQESLVLPDGDTSTINPPVRTNYDYIFLIATIVIAIIVMGYIIFTIVKSLKKESHYKTEYQELDNESIFVESEKISKKSNGFKIRKIYQKYLSFIEAYGIFRKKENTSKEILDRAFEVISTGPQDELREIYIKARYDNENDITDEDVLKAKELYKSIKDATKERLKEEKTK